jgi:lysozyme
VRARRLPACLLALALAACTARLPAPDPAAAPAAPAAPVIAPAFGESDPHPWDGRAPSAYPVHGSDASRYQTAVDWRAARAAGVNFVFLKATEGKDDLDPMFKAHWRGARAAGIRTGAYHFWYHCASGREQARNFIRRVPRAPGALPPVLDLEWTPFSPTCTRRPPGDELRREAQVFLDVVGAHYGQRPIVYVSPDIYAERDLGQLRGAAFWLRSVAGHPSAVYPGKSWTFWQYSGTGRIPGFEGDADLNLFNGSAADWAAWLAQHAR